MVNGCISEPEVVISGVPQRSVLGPILFLLYINDLPSVVNHSKIKLFTDDRKLYFLSEKDSITSDPLKQDLENVLNWVNSSQLTLALSKSSVLHLGNSNPHNQYILNGTTLPPVNNASDLVVTVDSDLKFSIHCTSVSKRASIVSYLIHDIFHVKKTDTLMRAYKTYCRPILEYASVVWNPYLIRDVNRLESVQRSFTRRIPQVRNLEYKQRMCALSLESLQTRRTKSDLIMVFKLLHRLVDIKYEHYFSLADNTVTRGHTWKLFKHRATSNVRKYFFSNRVINIWNKLPESVVSANTLSLFRTKLDSLDHGFFI